jgi:hypothetical protein
MRERRSLERAAELRAQMLFVRPVFVPLSWGLVEPNFEDQRRFTVSLIAIAQDAGVTGSVKSFSVSVFLKLSNSEIGLHLRIFDFDSEPFFKFRLTDQGSAIGP